MAYVSFEGKRSGIYPDWRPARKPRFRPGPGSTARLHFRPTGARWRSRFPARTAISDIYVLNPATGALRRLTNSSIDTEDDVVGRRQGNLFHLGPQRRTAGLRGTGRWQQQPATRDLRRTVSARPRVTPDGKSLVVVHNDQGNYRIALVDLQSKATRILTDGRRTSRPAWRRMAR